MVLVFVNLITMMFPFSSTPSGRGLSIRMALGTSQELESSGLETKTYITLQTKVYL